MTKPKKLQPVPQSDQLPPGVRVVSMDLEIDGTDQTIGVSAEVLSEGWGPVTMRFDTEMVLADDPELTEATDQLTGVISRRLANPNKTNRELLCTTCVGACCIKFPQVIVYKDDLPRLTEATGLKPDDMIAQGIIGGQASFGSVGYLGRTPLPKRFEALGNTACVFLAWDKKGVGRCSIYNNRPYTCRGFSERECDDKSPADTRLHKIRPNKKQQGAASRRLNMDTYIASQHTIKELVK